MMTRPIEARISLDALSKNLSRVRDFAPGSAVLSVIKANAYGHGLLPVASALSGSEGFALLELGEALKLRQAGYRQKIVLLEGFFSADELPEISAYEIDIVIHCKEQLDLLCSENLPKPVGVFLKFNSGMNRLGFDRNGFYAALERLRGSVNVSGIVPMTHFPAADLDAGIASEMREMEAVLHGLSFPSSLANSASLIRYPETRTGWVRPGIMLYGASPFPETSAAELGLTPVMTLASRIIAVQDLKPGAGVGYGPLFRADRPMRVGVAACGYADGYPRHAPNGTPVLVGGKRSRTIGRVSMDMLYVDLSGIDDAGIGTEVVLWGEGLPAEEVAHACGTISYELFCARAPRVPVSYY